MFRVFVFTIFVFNVSSQKAKGPPLFELNPQYSNSYIPPSMQIIGYLTELMKYDLKPTNNNVATTTSTVRPTPSHGPGLYAPIKPMGPQTYFARGNSYADYVQRLRSPAQKQLAADLGSIYTIIRQLDPSVVASQIDDLELLGQGPTDLFKLVNGVDESADDETDDEDVRLQKFVENYDDSGVSTFLTRQKKVPPTRAYVTLLSLYDLLNKESKKLGLNKYNGYSESLLKDLAAISTGTSAYQIRYVLNKIVQNKDTTDATLLKKINQLLTDFDLDNSYVNDALRYIPALGFDYE